MDKTQALFDYASKYTELKPVSGKYLGLCPVHKEKTPSFWVDGERAKCFGCGFGGDCFDLWQAITGGTFLEAKKALGFWDHSRPEPIKKGPPKPHFEKIFKPGNKRDGWLESVRSLKSGFDQEIIWKEKKYWNFQFIAECIRPLPDEEIEKWLIKIVNWFDDPIGRAVILKNLNEYLGRKRDE